MYFIELSCIKAYDPLLPYISTPSTGLGFGAGAPAQTGLPSFGGFQTNTAPTLNLTNKPSIGIGFGATTTTSTTTQANK